MALDPAARYQTASGFAAALRGANRPVRLWLFGAGVTVAGLALTVAIVTRSPQPVNQIPRDATLAIIVPKHRPPPWKADPTGRFSFRCPRTHDLNAYVVEADNVRIYHEWQDQTISYVGPALNDVEGRIVYRFDVDRPIMAARLLCTVFCGDGTVQYNVVGRGAGAIEVSKDGTTWIGICNSLDPPRWGEDHAIDGALPDAVLGGTSLWVRVRLLTTGSLKVRYTTAQFGRDFFDDFPELDGVFGLDLELEE